MYHGFGELVAFRADRELQFVWHDEIPDLRVSMGPFSAGWIGRLFTIASGKYQLHVYAAGTVRIKLDGRQVLDAKAETPRWLDATPVDLQYGYHPLEIEYQFAGKASRLGLYWSGPQFQLEPVPDRHLFHEPKQSPDDRFEQGQLLARALRCGACHETPQEQPALLAPSLTRLAGNLSQAWMVEWLSMPSDRPAGKAQPASMEVPRRMPHFALSKADAEAIAATLLAASELAPEPAKKTPAPPPKATADGRKKRGGKKSAPKPRTEPSAAVGEDLFESVGCLACHRVGAQGAAGLFGGGDLSAVAQKRPAGFFTRWLENPAAINANHRMPVFPLEPLERADLAAYLRTLGSDKSATQKPAVAPNADRGRQLIADYRCAACHALPTALASPAPKKTSLPAADWKRGCTGEPSAGSKQPGYRLSATQSEAVKLYWVAIDQSGQPPGAAAAAHDGQFVLAERNCLACHSRGAAGGIADVLTSLVAAQPKLAPLLPALAPPALTGVGDKLHDEALAAAILLRRPPLRPWLKIRMPRFPLSDDEMHALVEHFVEQDRIPDRSVPPAESADQAARVLAGSRLVTSDGFGCTSCHQVGSARQVNVALAAQGTDLSMLGERIRRPWYERWVRNPARIVPRMEMPAIQQPVHGVLGDNLSRQLAAVWTVLNEPGFEPPLPNPVRVVRARNVPGVKEPAVVLTDVVEVGKHVFLRPVLIGLPNRHNVLFDLETNRLAAWWIGDTARQRTRGKSWYWEAGGTAVLDAIDRELQDDAPLGARSELRLNAEGALRFPETNGQFLAELDAFEHTPTGVRIRYRLHFTQTADRPAAQLHVAQTIEPIEIHGAVTGLTRHFEIVGVPSGEVISHFDQKLPASVNRFLAAPKNAGMPTTYGVGYEFNLPVDQFPHAPQAEPPESRVKLDVVPGYEAVRLPLPSAEMPTGLAWRADGTLVIASLKGRVCLLRDTDGDGLEDQVTPFSDELAAPYGVAVSGEAIDVINKYGLLRLTDADHDGRAERTEVVADGWGYTADYHDWAVGLPRDAAGNYFIALPCQQDERSTAAARLRGSALKLTPRTPSPEQPRPYAVEPICAGLRFPMGLALGPNEDLFATDNQGNYTPFNELNHLVACARYGFINKLDVKPGFSPPFREPAIQIPHPWTRSVNGICFLNTPPAVRQKLGRDLFGPFEGHLLGCEYNNQKLVRMSLERVGETYQGAVYPFSKLPPADQPGFEGPIVCAVAPDGDVYVGNLRDSAWGGGQNTGSIVRLHPEGVLPTGIAEVRANPHGFTIDFTGPFDRDSAGKAKNYAVMSYRRIATPAYGGVDVDQQAAKIKAVEVAPDARRVTLALDHLRPGFVYELRLSATAESGGLLEPAEAYYTLHEIPTK
jgi:cytochrome c551/c552